MTPRTYGVTMRRTAPLRLAMHRDAPDQGQWRQWVADCERPIAIDLFSGAGGLSQGLEAAGYQVVLGVDTDEWALETHAHNFAGLSLALDLGDEEIRAGLVHLFDGLDVDLVAGGPPCQPFSRAGRSKIRSLVEEGARDAVDARKELWQGFVEIVEQVRPRAVLLENVPDMALGDDMVVVRSLIDRLESAEYEVDARIVNTWECGVPQHRQRLILVGVRDGASFTWPELAERVNVREAIGDLPELEVVPNSPVGQVSMPYGDPEMSDFARRARKHCTGDEEGVIHDHVTRAVRADDYEAFQLMAPGTLYSDLPDDMKRYRDDIFDDKYNRLDWSSYSRSITAHIAKDGYWYIHPEQHRTLTVREAARLQTFPDSFRFAGTRSHQFHQIGNAVPPALGEAIGVALLEATRLDGEPSSQRPSHLRAAFRTRLAAWAREDQTAAPWMYPSDPWTAAVGLILGAKGRVAWPDPEDVLAVAPTLEAATPRLLTTLRCMTSPGARRRAVERLEAAAAVVRESSTSWSSPKWRKAARLGPSAKAWHDVLTGESRGLVASTAVLRVTARLTGTDVDRQNRNSAGRMHLAKLIGGGPDAALLNAAMHRLGQLVCTSESPKCHACPLAELCEERVSCG
jgi:DNA (cytosine-5)-methyltransferase 1